MQLLDQAKIDYLKTAEPHRLSPYYWANFVLIGDATPISGSQTFWIWIIAIVVVLLLAGAGLWIKRKPVYS